jgi:hypothetical protein
MVEETYEPDGLAPDGLAPSILCSSGTRSASPPCALRSGLAASGHKRPFRLAPTRQFEALDTVLKSRRSLRSRRAVEWQRWSPLQAVGGVWTPEIHLDLSQGEGHRLRSGL